ncbi:MAG TPA: hypothetical protein VKH42_17200 [Vicinamibacterales bacterium]|nr:hypothetical protein [Vicinamibacterales bacterium]
MIDMSIPESVRRLERDLRGIFGPRLSSLTMYGRRSAAHDGDGHHAAHGHAQTPTHTLAIVDGLSSADLRACAARIDAWHDEGLATPLFIGLHEFAASLDAFPLEFGGIIADHVVVYGRNPFDGLAVEPPDLRRAVEVQARGHLLHLREGFVETRGRSDALAVLIVDSAPALGALLASVARLEGPSTKGVLAEVAALAHVREIPNAEAERLFAPYLDAVEQLVAHVDRWAR